MKRYIYWLMCVFALSSAWTANAQPNYNYSKLQKEKLGRGVVAIRESPSTVVVSWRYLSSDPMETAFNVYRDGKKLTTHPVVTGTLFRDENSSLETAAYEVRPVLKGKETHHIDGKYTLPANAPLGYLQIPLQKPADGVTPAGDTYTYSPNDASIGDVDGDGEYEIILKWEPSNAKDNSHDGYTGEVYFDCYRLNGEQLWRINLGKNIRAGAHYTQFMVYDLDGDGKAEVVMRTSDGTVDGKGEVIGNTKTDYREPGVFDKKKNKLTRQGRILEGNEYLTVFSGLTGEALYTTDYIPARGNPKDWGDTRANRSDRFLACIAYLDGVRPSVVMCRGYYTRIVLAAFNWDGKKLNKHWVLDTNTPGNEKYAKQGNHNLRVGDIDGDGCDEIIYGSCTIDHNGKGLYSTGLGHGDAIQLTQIDPARKGLQVWACHENKRDGSTYRDAATGEIILQLKSTRDIGRCMAADIDPTNPGVELWSPGTGGIINFKGELLAPKTKNFPVNMAVWWDGDLLREVLDKTRISKYDWEQKRFIPFVEFEGVASNNSTKATPCLQGDIIGDWREEVLFRSEDNNSLHLYVSTIPTEYRFHTFLEDPIYRISIATQNVGYNQPTQPGFYFGTDLKGTFRGYQFK